MIDALQYVWTEQWPANRAPSVRALRINQKTDTQNVYIPAGRKFTATLAVQDYENDDLQLTWELQKENLEIYFDNTVGQKKPAVVAQGRLDLKQVKTRTLVNGQPQYQLQFPTPPEEGPYRLFLYVSDVHRKAATTNATFYVYNK